MKQLLFSSSAVGPILCHKITNDLSRNTNEYITSVSDYAVDSPVTCLSSSGNLSSMLFGGRMDGNISILDIETKTTLSTLTLNPSLVDPVLSSFPRDHA